MYIYALKITTVYPFPLKFAQTFPSVIAWTSRDFANRIQ